MGTTARDFYQGLRQSWYNLIDTVRPWRAKVNASSSGLTTVKPDITGTALDEQFARIAGFKLSPDDEVMVLPFGGSHIVVGEIERAIPASRTLDAPLVIEGGLTATGVTSSGVLSATDIVGTSFNSPFIHTEAQSASDAASTTNTATYSEALVDPITLPAGTWTVYAIGSVALTHSAGGTANMLIDINGDNGTARAVAAHATVHQHIASEHILSSQSGTINVKVKFKSSTAGTTAARNPWLLVMAKRTA